jgi:multidrug efflux pump
VVALVYLPVLGGVTGRMSRSFGYASDALKRALPWWILRAALVPPALMVVFAGAMLTLNPGYFSGQAVQTDGMMASLPGIVLFLGGAVLASITLGAARIERRPRRIKAGYRRSLFGHFIHFITGNPIMPLVTIGAVGAFVVWSFTFYGANNNGVEFFVETEPEQAIIYVQARGNLSLPEKDALVRQVEEAALSTPGIQSIFAFAGEGGLNSNTAGAGGPADAIGQLQIELVPWEDRPAFSRQQDIPLEDLSGSAVIAALQARMDQIPGIRTEILDLAMGPGAAKALHLRLKGDDWEDLQEATALARSYFDSLPGLTLIEDTLPLPGIDWEITVDVEKAGRFGADVATVGAMVQLVTRGILLDTMRVDSSDEEIEIRVRLPEDDRVLSTLDSLRVRTPDGLVPLSNFITRTPVAKLAEIQRVDQQRIFDVLADVQTGLVKITDNGSGDVRLMTAETAETDPAILSGIEDGSLTKVAVNGNERIAVVNEWLATNPLPEGVSWEWTGDQQEQAESGQFLMVAFTGALGLMFIILLAQFNSIYNSVLVLLAVVLSTAGVLIGMIVMDQAFSIIMTGTGIVALAGIVVNNNIVLIDTYQEYSAYMPRKEAITRTVEDRIRPVLLTTITTMAGLAPMMFGLSLDFMAGGYTVNSPTALWWTQLATAVVFGLGIATVLTLVFTPAMLAARVWVATYARWMARLLAKLSFGRGSRAAQDWALAREARRIKAPEFIWADPDEAEQAPVPMVPLRAAE